MSESITEKWNRGTRSRVKRGLIGRQPGGREKRICSDWKLIRVVSGPRRTTRKVGRIVGSFARCSGLLNVTAELIGGERGGNVEEYAI